MPLMHSCAPKCDPFSVNLEWFSCQGKEVAVSIKRLPVGTVIFDDVAVEKRRGRIVKTLKSPHGRRQSDPLAGKIVYETVKG